MNTLILTTIATSLVGLCGLIGIFALFTKKEISPRLLHLMIAFSSGALLGEAFIHMIPEAAETLDIRTISYIILATLIGYFVIEKLLHWHHHDDTETDNHAIGVISLIGEAIHNFIDGFVVASAFVVSPALGIATTIAIITHEIPHELGNFAILIHSGFSKKQAVLWNFVIGLLAILGGIAGVLIGESVQKIAEYAVPFAAGGFLYIALSDLMPSLKHEVKGKNWIFSLFFVVLGCVLMFLVAG